MAKKDSVAVKVTVVPNSTFGKLWNRLRGKVMLLNPLSRSLQENESLKMQNDSLKKLIKRDTVKVEVKVKSK